MKIRTAIDLEEALTYEIGWRRAEVEFFSLQIENNYHEFNSRYLRAAAALLYAHWEGDIKNAGIAYFRFLNSRRLKHAELNPGLLSSSLKTKFDDFGDSSAAEMQKNFADFLHQDGLQNKARFSESLIETGANLSWTRFRRVLIRVGIDERPYSVNQRMIDRVLDWRNSIAHGNEHFSTESTPLTPETYKQAESVIIGLMMQFKNDILNSVATQSYLKSFSSD